MAKQCKQRHPISVGATEVVSVDYTDWLDSTESLTGTPTVAEVTSTDLTLTNLTGTANQATVSSSTLTILGESVSSGKALQFKVSGQTANTTYRVRVTASTDGTPARTEVIDVIFYSV